MMLVSALRERYWREGGEQSALCTTTELAVTGGQEHCQLGVRSGKEYCYE